MNIAPVVIENAKACIFKVESQIRVVVLKTAKLHARRRLDNGLGGAGQKDVHFLAVSGAELLAGHYAFDIFTVSEEYAAFDWTQHYAAVHTVVDGYSRRMVQYVDVAVLTLLNDKLLAIECAWQPANGFILEACQHEVFGINLLSFVPTVLLWSLLVAVAAVVSFGEVTTRSALVPSGVLFFRRFSPRFFGKEAPHL